MANRTHSIGMDVIGADSTTNRAVLIRVRNAGELARSQGSAATFAQALAPATIEGKVYDQIASQIKDALKSKNVDAEVTIVDPVGFRPADGSHVWTDVALGVGAVGALALLWRVLGGSK